MAAEVGYTDTCVIRDRRREIIQCEIMIVLAKDDVLRTFRHEPVSELSIGQPRLREVDEIVADSGQSHPLESYSCIAVVGDEALGDENRLRVPGDQDAATAIQAEDVVQKRNLSRSGLGIVKVKTDSEAKFEGGIRNHDRALRLHNRNAVPEHVGHLGVVHAEIGEAACYTASALANDESPHFQRGREAALDGYPQN